MRPSNRIEELESQLAEAVLTIRRLRDENERLHVRLGDDRFEPTEGPANLPVSSAIADAPIDARSTESEKIALFRGLFQWTRRCVRISLGGT
jgi:hypothetical protein